MGECTVEQKTKKVLSIGSYNVGLTCRTGRIPSWGETLIGSGFSESYGGKGSNQAVAAAKLGGEVTFVGCLGEDKYGDDGLAMLERAGVDTSYIIRTNKRVTGVGIILLNEENDNCIIVDVGANNELCPRYMDSIENVISDCDIVVFQLEIPYETVRRGMEIAKRKGKMIILNPAPARKEATELLSLASIVNPNESELLILNGKEPSDQLTMEECERLARQLLTKGPEVVIVTRGEKGCFIVTSKETVNIPAYPVNAIDTTGAGDAFTGALAVALAEGCELLEAVSFANLAGAYCVTKEEVVPAFATREQLSQFKNNKNFADIHEGEGLFKI